MCAKTFFTSPFSMKVILIFIWGVSLIFNYSYYLQISFYFLKFFHLPYAGTIEIKDTWIPSDIDNSQSYSEKLFLTFSLLYFSHLGPSCRLHADQILLVSSLIISQTKAINCMVISIFDSYLSQKHAYYIFEFDFSLFFQKLVGASNNHSSYTFNHIEIVFFNTC